MTLDTEKLEKLPKWAQIHIRQLERENTRLLKQLTEGPEDSNIYEDMILDGIERPIGKNSRIVVYQHGAGPDSINKWSKRFAVSLTSDNKLQVNAESMRVRPVASNLIELELADW